ncbi:hypothetical protein [Spirosoma foliorum]|uniref:Secretion system C-terminal sorting domain-containing protein n=1 Tax=Spirosoma foliorum TaxID=2710596 RepID=A0A7G5H0S7_9BACT|nr:hypothetical protein [Spirosoma foliorum]QMW04719.1 hypothetical protein H3H32_07260 [Spirosoma foliorum]
MKLLKHSLRVIANLGLILLSLTSQAQSTDQEPIGWSEEKPFELGTYMGANRTVNVILLVKQVNGITLKIKNTDELTLHELFMKRSPRAYHWKLNFEGSKSGTYKLEISDGQTTIIRRIEVVDVPSIEAQRYITFSSPLVP